MEDFTPPSGFASVLARVNGNQAAVITGKGSADNIFGTLMNMVVFLVVEFLLNE